MSDGPGRRAIKSDAPIDPRVNVQNLAAAPLPEAAPQSAAQLQANAAYDSTPPNVAGDPFRDLAQVVVSAGKQAQAVGGDVTEAIGSPMPMNTAAPWGCGNP
jgi:hypothetical protein